MSMNVFPVAKEESAFGDSCCRPPGDGQEHVRTLVEHPAYRQYEGPFSTRKSDQCSKLPSSKEANKYKVSKMKRTEVGDALSEVEPSRNALSSYLQWAKDLHILLEDTQGLELFQRYLDSENISFHSLHFWLAVGGLKNYMHDPVQLGKAAKAIYKRFVKASVVTLKPDTKQEISNMIFSRKRISAEIYDRARLELEETVLHALYANFLKSDLYLQYLQKMHNGPPVEESSRQSESSGSNSSTGSRDMLNIMPTVPEESELHVDYKCYTGAPVVSVPTDPYRHRFSGSGGSVKPASTHRFSNSSPYTSSKTHYSNSPYAKYSSYLPPSAQDSDRQSVSSGAHTDDAMSISDLDIMPMHLNKSSSSYERSMRKNAHANIENNEFQPVIPRTHRVHKEVVEAEKNPHSFAAKLIGKLSLLNQEMKKCEKLNEALNKVDIEDDGNSSNLKRFEGIPQQLLTASIQEKLSSTNESESQMILDQHVLRVWNESSHQTPNNLTPGQYSPPFRTKSPTMDNPKFHITQPPNHGSQNPLSTSSRHRSYETHVSSQSTSRSSAYLHHRHRKERDTCSVDSGTVQDFVPERCQSGLMDHPQAVLSGSSSSRRMRDGSSSSRRSSQKKMFSGDSASSCFDSGVSVCDPIHPAVRDKVSSWLSNEEYSCSQGSNSEKDSSTHHKKSTHSSVSNSSGNQSKQSKKQTYSLSSRTGAFDHGGSQGWVGSSQQNSLQQQGTLSSLAVQPQQGYDLSVNSGYGPDITAQLVEAKKRLEEETRHKQLSASRSKKLNKRASNNCGSSSSDRLQLPGSSIPSAGSSVMGSSTSSGEQTTVYYCFSGEQIPYLTKLTGKNITLKQFKSLITKRGNFRYFFKSINNEFEKATVVQEEVTDDNAFVPLWDGKVHCTIEPCPDS